METKATMFEDGSFDLHSPSPQSAKFMSSTIPIGMPCIGIVMARLIVHDTDHGVRAFIVQLNDGKSMCQGIHARQLPPRDDTDTVNHSLTSFHHVKLPRSALLGSLAKPESNRMQFLSTIRRVTIGSLIVATLAIPSIQIAVYTAAKYSHRRKVQAAAPEPFPIFSLKTQQRPILYGFVDSIVFKALLEHVIPKFHDSRNSEDLLRAYAAICKVLFYKHHQDTLDTLIGRMGAQGVFRYNGLTSAYNMIRGYSIGEGETLVLSIRLATELLLGRYSLESSHNPKSFLAQHEHGVFKSCTQKLAQLPSHRSEGFNELIIPQCKELVEALAHRMAYDAAKSSGVDQAVIELFEVQAMQCDASWYIENGLITRDSLNEKLQKALDCSLSIFDRWLETEKDGLEKYISAPIISSEAWGKFLNNLPEFADDVGDKKTGKLAKL
ncbi:hypothetical protein VKT23_016709 [Stygiomarasmius scandens]